MCGREEEKTMKRKNGMTLQCLAGTVRQQLMLRNLTILFMFFLSAQAGVGKPRMGGACRRKKERGTTFFSCVRDLFR